MWWSDPWSEAVRSSAVSFERLPPAACEGDEAAACALLGGWFVANGSGSAEPGPLLVSPKHGRSLAIPDHDAWVSIKGIGWTLGGPRVLCSPKDTEMVFGLFGRRDAEREIRVSRRFAALGLDMPRVLGLRPLTGPHDGAVYRNGDRVDPVLLYTRTRCPVRVADLAYYSPAVKASALAASARVMGWSDVLTGFCRHLGATVGRAHRLGCANDTLAFDNVTLCAEVVDFEWLFVPGEPLPDGTTDENLLERQRKEMIYGLEVGCDLAALSGGPPDYAVVHTAFRDGYVSEFPDGEGWLAELRASHV